MLLQGRLRDEGPGSTQGPSFRGAGLCLREAPSIPDCLVPRGVTAVQGSRRKSRVFSKAPPTAWVLVSFYLNLLSLRLPSPSCHLKAQPSLLVPWVLLSSRLLGPQLSDRRATRGCQLHPAASSFSRRPQPLETWLLDCSFTSPSRYTLLSTPALLVLRSGELASSVTTRSRRWNSWFFKCWPRI